MKNNVEIENYLLNEACNWCLGDFIPSFSHYDEDAGVFIRPIEEQKITSLEWACIFSLQEIIQNAQKNNAVADIPPGILVQILCHFFGNWDAYIARCAKYDFDSDGHYEGKPYNVWFEQYKKRRAPERLIVKKLFREYGERV